MGRVEAANAADHAIQRWQPRYILLVGIAGGYGKAGVQLGDVLIAKQVADYEEQNLQTNKTTIRWQVYQIDPGLVAQSQNLLDDSWTNLIKVERPRKGKTSIVHGLICTGDKVIANGLLGEFQQTWDRLIGVEMEAGGVARAAFQAGVSRPGFFMIRGVSDLADKNKKSRIVKKWRTYACHAAAAYTISLLKNGPVAPAQDRPHEPLPRHEDETSRLLAGTVMTAAEFINEPLLDTSEQEDVSTPELFAPSSQESALVEAAENGQGIIEPEGAGKGPTAWLLEAVRRVPTLKYAIGVVGLVAAAVISAALAFGHWQYALFGAIAVFGGMLLVRIYAASQPEHIRFNPSFAFHVVLWTCVIAFVLLVVMGLIRLGLNLFAAEREAVGEKPVPEIPSKDHADTPRKPAQYPSEQIIFDIPPREKVEKVSRLKPTEVTFKYKNNTGEDLELFLYSFSRHYDKNRKPSDATTAWFADWNFPATGKFGVFDRFQTGCGWYGFVVRGKKKSASGGYDHHLCCRDIFEHKVATLTVVAEAGNPDRPYKAVFGSEE
jgi:nucleoside phosphorylase